MAALLLALASTTPNVEVGAVLPVLTAQTLDGHPSALPRDAHAHPAILVFGFSKSAVKQTRPWLEQCRAAAGISCYDVRMLEEVPKSFRGMVERSMTSGLPPELLRFTLLVYTGNDAWRGALGAADEKAAYVVGIDREGRIAGEASGAFDSAKLAHLLELIQAAPVAQ